jgi:hypothetical protein
MLGTVATVAAVHRDCQTAGVQQLGSTQFGCCRDEKGSGDVHCECMHPASSSSSSSSGLAACPACYCGCCW